MVQKEGLKKWSFHDFLRSGPKGAQVSFPGPSQGIPSEPKGAKMESRSHPKPIKSEFEGTKIESRSYPKSVKIKQNTYNKL